MDTNKWKAVIGKHLPKRAKQMCRALMLDIVVVDCGIKASYLYDIGAPGAELLSKFLSDLKHEQLITNCLDVLCVGMDCFIVNIEALKCLYEGATPDTLPKLVDVSPSLPQPSMCDEPDIAIQLLSSLNGLIKSVFIPDNVATTSHDFPSCNEGKSCEVVPTDKGKYFVFIPTADCNISSIFGLLLGYPTVYWYNTAKGEVGNCLAMEPLICVKLLGIYELPNLVSGSAATTCLPYKHQIYSFSYPTCLNDKLTGFVTDWLEMVQHKVAECNQVFASCTVHIEEVTCEAVGL